MRLSSTGFAILGAGLIAISYGLARFAFGLFVPPIRDELGLSSYVIGIIGSLPLISFLLATVIAPLVTRVLGARYAAILSGGFGVAGFMLISRASGPMAKARTRQESVTTRRMASSRVSARLGSR